MRPKISLFPTLLIACVFGCNRDFHFCLVFPFDNLYSVTVTTTFPPESLEVDVNFSLHRIFLLCLLALFFISKRSNFFIIMSLKLQNKFVIAYYFADSLNEKESHVLSFLSISRRLYKNL